MICCTTRLQTPGFQKTPARQECVKWQKTTDQIYALGLAKYNIGERAINIVSKVTVVGSKTIIATPAPRPPAVVAASVVNAAKGHSAQTSSTSVRGLQKQSVWAHPR